MECEVIKSVQNKNVKYIKSLQLKKNRDEFDRFLIEGEKFVFDIPKNCFVEMIMMSESYYSKNANMFDKEYRRVCEKVFVAEDFVFASLSDTKTPQGIVAVCEKKKSSFKELSGKGLSLYLVMEEVCDPGNVGTMIRTAVACGVDGIFITKKSADIFSSKVLRATASTIFSIPIVEDCEIDEILEFLENEKVTTVGTYLNTNKTPYELDFREKSAIIIGNEARGISKNVVKKCKYLVKLPITEQAESLNASIACGAMLFEVVRQRM